MTKDGCGAVCGTLVAPNRLAFVRTDKLGGKELVYAALTGNVVETEYNEVVVLGKLLESPTKENDGIILVQKMESLYVDGAIKQYTGLDAENNPYVILVIPKEKFQESKRKNTMKGNTYAEVKASGGERITVFVPINRPEVNIPDGTAPYVFMAKGKAKIEDITFGRNEKWKYYKYPFAEQMEN